MVGNAADGTIKRYDRDGFSLDDDARPDLVDLVLRLHDWSIATDTWDAPVWRDVELTLRRYGTRETAGGAFEDCAQAAAQAHADAEGLVVGSYECPECGYEWSELAALFADAACPRCAERNVPPHDCHSETTPGGDICFEPSPF